MAENEEVLKLGATGPNETWQAGDYCLTLTGPARLSTQQAAALNEQASRAKDKAHAGELARLVFNLHRPCPTCGLQFPAEVLFRQEGADCAPEHGLSEHLDRSCRRCSYLWAETLP